METMEDCFRDICNIGVGYKRVKVYCRAAFNTQEASTITEVKTTKEPGPCYKCGGPNFQNNCTSHKSNNSNKFQNMTLTEQNYKESKYTQMFHGNRNNSNMFPTGVLSVQATQPSKLWKA